MKENGEIYPYSKELMNVQGMMELEYQYAETITVIQARIINLVGESLTKNRIFTSPIVFPTY